MLYQGSLNIKKCRRYATYHYIEAIPRSEALSFFEITWLRGIFITHDSFVHDSFVHDSFVHDSFVHGSFVHGSFAHDPYFHAYWS